MKNKENIGNTVCGFLVIVGLICMLIPLLYKIYEWFGWPLLTFIAGIICVLGGVITHFIIEDET